jgi:hypothetical protein
MGRCGRLIVIALFAGGVASAAGCQRHFRVTDPDSGKAYYTRRIQRGFAGQIKFTDARTGSRVRLESSEVKRIPEGEFHEGLLAQ